jgi:hypothetical protein
LFENVNRPSACSEKSILTAFVNWLGDAVLTSKYIMVVAGYRLLIGCFFITLLKTYSAENQVVVLNCFFNREILVRGWFWNIIGAFSQGKSPNLTV